MRKPERPATRFAIELALRCEALSDALDETSLYDKGLSLPVPYEGMRRRISDAIAERRTDPDVEALIAAALRLRLLVEPVGSHVLLSERIRQEDADDFMAILRTGDALSMRERLEAHSANRGIHPGIILLGAARAALLAVDIEADFRIHAHDPNRDDPVPDRLERELAAIPEEMRDEIEENAARRFVPSAHDRVALVSAGENDELSNLIRNARLASLESIVSDGTELIDSLTRINFTNEGGKLQRDFIENARKQGLRIAAAVIESPFLLEDEREALLDAVLADPEDPDSRTFEARSKTFAAINVLASFGLRAPFGDADELRRLFDRVGASGHARTLALSAPPAFGIGLGRRKEEKTP
jgi:hypothetical protein